MTTLTAAGALLAADATARTLTYRLLPYGEPGRTNLGTVTVDAGVVTLPASASSLVLNLEHERGRPVGRGVSLLEDAAGLVATFAIADTTAGRDLLAEAAAGLRTGVSVELDDVTIRDGRLTAAALVGAGAVVAPAFPSALLVASDTPLEDDDPAPVPPAGGPAGEDPDDDADAVDDTPTDGDTVTSTTVDASAPAAAPAALVASATPPSSGPLALTMPRVSRLLASFAAGDRSPELLAALSDITYTAAAEVMPPAFIGEAWSQTPDRQIVPLLASGNLTSLKVQGWRWTTPPAGADYAGDKTAVPSNAAATEAIEWVAERWAGAHDVDRAFVDFTVPGFWESYWAAMAASYASWSDANAAAGLLAGATAVVPDGDGVVAALVKAALQVIPYGSPTYAILGATAFAELVERDPLAFLAGNISLSTGDGNVAGLAIRASSAIGTSQVVVGVRQAATWYELGSAPIRVEGVNIANGGVDVGAFGYGVVGVHKAQAIAKADVVHTP